LLVGGADGQLRLLVGGADGQLRLLVGRADGQLRLLVGGADGQLRLRNKDGLWEPLIKAPKALSLFTVSCLLRDTPPRATDSSPRRLPFANKSSFVLWLPLRGSWLTIRPE